MSQQPESAARAKPSRKMCSSKQLPWSELTNAGVTGLTESPGYGQARRLRGFSYKPHTHRAAKSRKAEWPGQRFPKKQTHTSCGSQEPAVGQPTEPSNTHATPHVLKPRGHRRAESHALSGLPSAFASTVCFAPSSTLH